MADRLRREKDIIKSKEKSYLKTITEDYISRYEGSPTYVTYYQYNAAASTQDMALENVHSLIGDSSPRKYNKIYDVVIYGVDTLDIVNELNERGLVSTITGEFIILPDTIRPYPNDYFVFDSEGLESHLFRITDVQFDKASPRKFFRCQFSLSNQNSDEIFNNVTEDFQFVYESLGTESSVIIKKADAVNADKLKTLSDEIINKFVKLFYDDDMDSFVCKDKKTGDYLWSPYLQHFLHETQTVRKFNSGLMEEIYILDISEVDHPEVYKEEVYRDSLFRAVELQNKEVEFHMNFVDISDKNLKGIRNLPFFSNNLKYKVVSPIDTTQVIPYTNACNIIFRDQRMFRDLEHDFKLHKLDDLHFEFKKTNGLLKENDIVYECLHELHPQKIARIDSNLNYRICDLEAILNEEYTDVSILVKIITDFLTDTLVITDEIIKELNEYYYKISLHDYLLMPLVIYILKENINKTTN